EDAPKRRLPTHIANRLEREHEVRMRHDGVSTISDQVDGSALAAGRQLVRLDNERSLGSLYLRDRRLDWSIADERPQVRYSAVGVDRKSLHPIASIDRDPEVRVA